MLSSFRKILIVMVATAAASLGAVAWAAAPAEAANPPAPPTNLHTTNVTFTSIDLAWNPSTNPSVQFYKVLVNGVWRNTAYGTTSGVAQLSPGTAYHVEVRTVDTAGTESSSATITVTTLADSQPPTTPTNLRVERDEDGTPIALQWDASADNRGIGGYRLYDSGTFLRGVRTNGISFALLVQTCVLVPGQTIVVTVQAQDLSGLLSGMSNSVTVTVP
jgi:hypothetical protein